MSIYASYASYAKASFLFSHWPESWLPSPVDAELCLHELPVRTSLQLPMVVRESDWAILATGPPANLVFLAELVRAVG